MTAQEALEHRYFKDHYPPRCAPDELPKIEKDSHEFQSKNLNKQKHQQHGQGQAPKQNNPHHKDNMIVAKQGYQNHQNPNYFSKNQSANTKGVFETKKNEDYFGGATITNFPSRLEALVSKDKPSENFLLNSKRHMEPTQEGENNYNKKQRTNFSPTK
jgi:hypothetical protein